MTSARLSNPILIVSTGRTGTRFIASLLDNCHPEVEAHHTTRWSTLINVLGNMHLAGFLPEAMLLAVWRRLKSREFAVTDKTWFVDSNNHLYVFAASAHKIYPQAKIVHVIRDPRTYVRSHLNWARERPRSFVANHLLPFWQPNGYLQGELTLSEWVALGSFGRFCWVWDFKNRYLSGLAGGGLPYLLVRFEDLVSESQRLRTLECLRQFIGVPTPSPAAREPTERFHNETTRRRFPHWMKWSDERCAQLHRLCGSQMARYGYGQEPEWQRKLGSADAGLAGASG